MAQQPHSGSRIRFLPSEVAEMEAIAQRVTGSVFPPRNVINALAEKFNASPDRAGHVPIQPKQVLTWFQNRRYAPRIKETKAKRAGNTVRSGSNLHETSSSSVPPPVQPGAASGSKRVKSGQVQMHPVPFKPNECVHVHCRDTVICYQEKGEYSFYCEAYVLARQRTPHDSSECHCKFLVRYEHDETEEIVPLNRLCRRPSTRSYRLPNFYAASRLSDSADRGVQPTQSANVAGATASASGVAVKSVEAAAPVIIEIDDD